MANKSDEIIKREMLDIGDIGRLKLRVFPGGSREDQKHWVEGGLSFGVDNIMYGSCDGAWYAKGLWTDPLSKRETNFIPVLAVEGTLALERGSGGNAQYQRFFHTLGAVLSGVIGVYYLRAGTHLMRYDLPKAALNASELHGTDYLIVDDLKSVKAIVQAMETGDRAKYNAVAVKIKERMKAQFDKVLQKRFKGDMEAYFKSRSIIRLKNANIKYLGGNYRNFTESSQRGGHIVLGEFLLAKYMLKEPFYFLLPRLLKTEIKKLDDTKKKEWLVMRNDNQGKLITLDNLEGVDDTLRRRILELKNQPLGGSKQGGQARVKWAFLMQELGSKIRKGIIVIKT
jgi:hypothetical protein